MTKCLQAGYILQYGQATYLGEYNNIFLRKEERGGEKEREERKWDLSNLANLYSLFLSTLLILEHSGLLMSKLSVSATFFSISNLIQEFRSHSLLLMMPWFFPLLNPLKCRVIGWVTGWATDRSSPNLIKKMIPMPSNQLWDHWKLPPWRSLPKRVQSYVDTASTCQAIKLTSKTSDKLQIKVNGW